MAMVAMISGGAAPGVTTSAALLAAAWPRHVLLADCDPSGGQLASGWLAEWLLSGEIRAGVGVVSFATATRHAKAGSVQALRRHLQDVPPAGHVGLLAGARDARQSATVGQAGWSRVADALHATSADGRSDVLVDCGRLGSDAPLSVLRWADLVLVAVRPVFRSVLLAQSAVAQLADQVDRNRLGLVVCAGTDTGGREVQRALRTPTRVLLPYEPRTAMVYSDGAPGAAVLPRSPLVEAARAASRVLACGGDVPDGRSNAAGAEARV